MLLHVCVQVLARSSPEDKLTLVSMLKKEGEVVAVTGVSLEWLPGAHGASTAAQSLSVCVLSALRWFDISPGYTGICAEWTPTRSTWTA
jgi:hypothetical protein